MSGIPDEGVSNKNISKTFSLPPYTAQRVNKRSQHEAPLKTIPELCKESARDVSWPSRHYVKTIENISLEDVSTREATN